MKRGTLLVARLCGLLSGLVPTRIVVCAENAVASHVNLGYRSDKIRVIPNGYNFAKFSRDSGNRDALRDEIGLPADTPLLGLIGRYTPQKDHANLLRALGVLAKRREDFHAVLVGAGLDASNVELQSLAAELGIGERLSWLGERSDVPEIMQALDLHVLSSRLEGFPNVLAEAMASGTPCVSTDVGDAGLILGGLGWLVPRENSEELAAAIVSALSERRERPEDWKRRCNECRDRVADEFSLQKMVDSYFDLWQSAAPSHD
jgi:glycosyltransferase involved in cell wall biosynthesis